MIERGIVDPTKVTRSRWRTRQSVAAMVLTTESLVADLPQNPRRPGSWTWAAWAACTNNCLKTA